MTLFLYVLQYLKLILLVVGIEDGVALILLIRGIFLSFCIEPECWNIF